MPTAAHFIYIPSILLLGVVLGWILGSRAAADAYASQARRNDAKTQRSRNAEAQRRGGDES
jgi:hypothetical protein